MPTHIIKRLDQAALLTDPLKLQLMEQFSVEPRTTKQVADLMVLKAPRLYRHVEALVEAGLLVFIREQPKRGTVERYYQTIASRFELDPELLNAGNLAEDENNEMTKLIRQIFHDTQQELISLIQNTAIAELENDISPIVMRLTGSVSPKEFAALRHKLIEWLGECELKSEEKGQIPLRGLITFFPLKAVDTK
jgi:predicted ArsR family transcriptional regulator